MNVEKRTPRQALYAREGHKLTGQARQVYSYLLSKGYITAADAARSKELTGIVGGALTARISELRALGFEILRETKVDPVSGRRYSKYFFAPEAR